MRHAVWVALLAACNPSMPSADAATLVDAFVTPTADAAHAVDAAALGDAFTRRDAGDDAHAVDAGATDAGASSLGDVLTQATFDAMFVHRGEAACNAAVYDYAALIAAAARFPAFASTGSMDDRRRELAAFLANASHETTGGWSTAPDGPYAWGLCFREEVGCSGGTCTGYCDTTSYPCPSGQTYYGRGPLQLSWNYNYAQCGTAIGQDLLNHPSLVATDGTIGWESALWFWMTPQSPKPSCHDATTGGWTPSAADTAAGRRPGFGVTIDVINGGLECHMPGDTRVADRIGFYARYTTLLGVSPGPDVDCATMQPF